MQKLIVTALISLDGVGQDPRSWASAFLGDEAAKMALRQLRDSDALLMGRGTYNYARGIFHPERSPTAAAYRRRIEGIRKYVFSVSLGRVAWKNTTLVVDDAVGAVQELKRQATSDLVMYGYGELAVTLLHHGLVDELDLWVHPVVLGTGQSIFSPGQHLDLRLLAGEQRADGVVAMRYALS